MGAYRDFPARIVSVPVNVAKKRGTCLYCGKEEDATVLSMFKGCCSLECEFCHSNAKRKQMNKGCS